ncbi:uncharacterized protein JCM15063_004809 [Sporobolomyces koalae]|uniref:uncharacterized protein n=1 Tax=Sporobolomyces koalae TaxID=500713 RepID=UPI003176E35A
MANSRANDVQSHRHLAREPQPRRTSTNVASPRVFEDLNPHNEGASCRSSQSSRSDRDLVMLSEEPRYEPNSASRKRRANDEVEAGVASRRDSNGASSERRNSSDSSCTRQATIALPSNPHPVRTRHRSCSRSPDPFAQARAPRSAFTSEPLRHQPSSDDIPSQSKRARTSTSTLESLAATATTILSSKSSSPRSSSASTPPTTASATVDDIFGLPSYAQSAEHKATLEACRHLREEQQIEIDRRRIASGRPTQPRPGSISAALGKLKAENRASSPASRVEREDHGLAQRRGRRPPPVSTSSFDFSTQPAVAVASARPHEDTTHAAQTSLPGVLVRNASTREPEQPETSPSFTDIEPSRRQSFSTNHLSYPSAREQSRMPQSARTSEADMFFAKRRSQERVPSHPASDRQHRRTSDRQQPHSPGHSYRSNERLATAGTRLPPLSLIHLGSGGGPSPPWTSAPHLPSASSIHPNAMVSQAQSRENPSSHRPNASVSTRHDSSSQSHHHSNLIRMPPPSPAHPAPAQSPDSHSSSKHAFLSLFSTFFDSLQDSKVLTTTLEHQIARSSSLLSTLQQSEQVFEALVNKRMVEAERSWRKDVESSTTALERRLMVKLERLEQLVHVRLSEPTLSNQHHHRPASDSVVGLGLVKQPHTIDQRIEKLERILMLNSEKSSVVSTASFRDGSVGTDSLPTPDEDRLEGARVQSVE